MNELRLYVACHTELLKPSRKTTDLLLYARGSIKNNPLFFPMNSHHVADFVTASENKKHQAMEGCEEQNQDPI